jgi:hypothetical protein
MSTPTLATRYTVPGSNTRFTESEVNAMWRIRCALQPGGQPVRSALAKAWMLGLEPATGQLVPVHFDIPADGRWHMTQTMRWVRWRNAA